MPRYIDAEFLDDIVDELNRNGYDISDTTLFRGKIILSHIPTADVVEVVRCRDCENWDDPYCCVLDDAFDEKFFCALGERRKNEV